MTKGYLLSKRYENGLCWVQTALNHYALSHEEDMRAEKIKWKDLQQYRIGESIFVFAQSIRIFLWADKALDFGWVGREITVLSHTTGITIYAV